MTHRALFVPGLFVSPKCENYAALRNGFAKRDITLDFLDFTFAYTPQGFGYKALVKQTTSYIKDYQTIITYSLGSNIFLDALHESGHEQPENVVFLSPIGNPEKSSFGAKAAEWKRDGCRLSRPCDYFPGGFKMPYSFYEEKLDLYQQNSVHLTGNSLAIIGKHDPIVSYDIVDDMQKFGVEKVALIDDTHNLMQIRRVLPDYLNSTLPTPLWS